MTAKKGEKKPKLDKKRRSRGSGSVYKKGHVYMARWVVSLDGRRKAFTRSTETGDKDEAIKKLAEYVAPYRLGSKEKILRNQVAELGGVKAQIQKFEDEKPSLDLASAWAAYTDAPNRPDSGQRTMAGYASQFERFAVWMKKTHPAVTELRSVTEEIAFQFAGEIGKKLTPNSFNKYLVLLRRVWKVLRKPAKLTCNPWENLDNKLLATHSRRELTIEELTSVCAAVKGEMRILFAVGLYCGLRLGDAVLLKWSNVDLIRRLMMIVPAKTARRSNGKVLRIPLHGSLFSMLAETPEEERLGYVMPELAEMYQHDDTALVKRISEVFKACGIKTRCKVEGYSRLGVDVGFHSLRHSFVSLSANAGSSLAAVQAVVGHSNPAMTRHYLHADQNIVKKAVYALPDVTGTTPIPEPADAAKAEKAALLAIAEGMTAKTWKANRDKLISMLKSSGPAETQSGEAAGKKPSTTPNDTTTEKKTTA